MILLVALSTAIAILTLTVDRAAPGTKPARWNLTEIFSYSAAYGVYMALSTSVQSILFAAQARLKLRHLQRIIRCRDQSQFLSTHIRPCAKHI
jgi:hypothetical protein